MTATPRANTMNRDYAVYRRPRCAARGLTLLEVILSIALIVMMMATLVTFFWQTLETRDTLQYETEQTNLARQVLSRMAEELRGCVGYEQVGFPVEQRFTGDRRSIAFLTTVLPADDQYAFLREDEEPPPARHDLTLVSYRLWVDESEQTEDGDPLVGGILRTERKTLNQFLIDDEDPLTERNDLWSAELGYLEFRYFDGVEWTTSWQLGQGNSLPQAVLMVVGYEPLTMDEYEDRDLDEYPIEEYPFGPDTELGVDRYMMVVRMPAADSLFGSRFQRLGQEFAEQMGVEGLSQ